MPAKKRLSRTWSVVFLLINVVTWGAALPIVKPALTHTTPFQYLFYRFLLAAVFSLPIFFYYMTKVKQPWRKMVTVVGLELIGTTLALGLLYEGLARTTSLEASLIATTTPLFTALGGILYLREKEERHEWIGLAIALTGTVLLALEPIITGRNGQATFSFTGNLLVFGQNIATAAYFVLAKKYYRQLPKFFVTSVSFYVGIVTFALLSMWKLQLPLHEFISQSVLELQIPSVAMASFYMAIFGSIIGLTAYIIGQDGIEASEASLFSYLQPIVYIPLATLFLHEPVTWPMLLAVTIVAVGVVVAEVRWRRPRRRRGRRTPLLSFLR